MRMTSQPVCCSDDMDVLVPVMWGIDYQLLKVPWADKESRAIWVCPLNKSVCLLYLTRGYLILLYRVPRKSPPTHPPTPHRVNPPTTTTTTPKPSVEDVLAVPFFMLVQCQRAYFILSCHFLRNRTLLTYLDLALTRMRLQKKLDSACHFAMQSCMLKSYQIILPPILSSNYSNP